MRSTGAKPSKGSPSAFSAAVMLSRCCSRRRMPRRIRTPFAPFAAAKPCHSSRCAKPFFVSGWRSPPAFAQAEYAA